MGDSKKSSSTKRGTVLNMSEGTLAFLCILMLLLIATFTGGKPDNEE